VKNASRLPIPVASPANSVSPKASNTFSILKNSPFETGHTTPVITGIEKVGRKQKIFTMGTFYTLANRPSIGGKESSSY
jgi:hypothetical protein